MSPVHAQSRSKGKKTKYEQLEVLPNTAPTTAMAHTRKFYLETSLKRRTSLSLQVRLVFFYFVPLPHKKTMNTKLVTGSSPRSPGRIHKDGTSPGFFKKPVKKQMIATTHSYENSNKPTTLVNKLLAHVNEHWKHLWVQNIIICDIINSSYTTGDLYHTSCPISSPCTSSIFQATAPLIYMTPSHNFRGHLSTILHLGQYYFLPLFLQRSQ